jgi:hypothetical protein
LLLLLDLLGQVLVIQLPTQALELEVALGQVNLKRTEARHT